MLAARDQENLVHGHQAAAASKPLNQGIKQYAPKTPGNKAPKTPFKLPLNDENGPPGFGGGKTGHKTMVRGNENSMIAKKGGLGDKNAFVTPMGPRNRAPLGLKTTNAKTKAFQTPAPPATDQEFDKVNQKSVTGRKPKSRVSHAEMTKIEVLGDQDDLKERDVEYAPPRVPDMPDIPDDIVPQDLDFSIFKDGGFTRGWASYFDNLEDEDGLSRIQRQEIEEQKAYDLMDKRVEAAMQAQIDCSYPCNHSPECPGDICKDNIAAKARADELVKNMYKPVTKKLASGAKKPISTKTPSTFNSRSAAAALSQPKPSLNINSIAPVPQPKSKGPSSILSNRKQTPPPTNPSLMRHTASTAASRTTMGYSKGRSASATLRGSVLPQKQSKAVNATKRPLQLPHSENPDISLAPAVYIHRYGVPPLGSEMWFRCQRAGCFDEEDASDGVEDALKGITPGRDWVTEQAEEEFVLTL